jgi:putative membrane protein
MCDRQFLNDEQISTIEAAIKSAEDQTSCEIVPILAESSDKYLHASYLVGFILALCTYLLVMIFTPYTATEHWDALTFWEYNSLLLVGMVASFILGACISQYVPWLKLPFLSKDEMQLQVQRRARQAYFDLCRGRTQEDTGIIIFVSLFEHTVIILGDNTVSKKIAQEEWNQIKDQMLKQLKNGALADAFCEGILKTGALVKDRLPISCSDVNELPNKLHFL